MKILRELKLRLAQTEYLNNVVYAEKISVGDSAAALADLKCCVEFMSFE